MLNTLSYRRCLSRGLAKRPISDTLPEEISHASFMDFRRRTSTGAVLTLVFLLIALSSSADTTGLISWWRADGNANDSAGGNHGFATNGATYTTGRIGQGFALDGVDDFFEFPTNGLALLTNNFTIEGWLKTTTTKNYSSIVGFDGYYPGLYLYTSTGYLDLYPATSTVTGGYNDGQWHHFAVRRINDYLNYYKDGVQDLVVTPLFSSIAPTRVTIGSSLIGSESFPGVIDEVAIYNRALSTNEIIAIATGQDIKSSANAPSLAIARSGNAVVLSWPSTAVGFNLQTIGTLGPTNWQNVTNPAVLNGDSYRTTNSIAAAAQYFRLFRP